ncbi:MAG: hypothetical protein GXY67_07645 [Clostridiales bacterium]|nr:hypothetical protein [Clostridiales bacterium]
MNIKRWTVLILALALLCLPQAAFLRTAKAETAQVELYGLITEVVEGGILLADEQRGEVLLNVDAETVLEGILSETPLEKGMYVYAKYNGILTRSQPPQAHADRLGCYTLEGTVAQVTEMGAMLTGDKLFGDAIIRLSPRMPHVLAGVPIKVYYNGTMAMSMPPQVQASYVVVPVLTGTVKNVSDNGFTLVAEDETLYTVEVDGLTLLPTAWFDGSLEGKKVTVYYDGIIGEGDILRSLEVVDPSLIVQEPTPMPTPEPTQAPEDPAPSDPTTDVPDNTDEQDGINPSAAPEAASGEVLQSLPSPTPMKP